MNLARILLPNFGSGRTSRFAATLLRGMRDLYVYSGEPRISFLLRKLHLALLNLPASRQPRILSLVFVTVVKQWVLRLNGVTGYTVLPIKQAIS